MGRVHALVCLIVAAMLTLAASADSVSAAPVAGAAEFAGELLQHAGFLLTDEEKSSLDEINRLLREAQHQRRTAKNDDTREAATQKLAEAGDALIAFMERCSPINRVAIEGTAVTPSIRGPHALPGDDGAIILRIDAGDGEARFVTRDINQAEDYWEREAKIECAPAGVTWALLRLSHFGRHRTTLRVEFHREGKEPAATLVDVTTPSPGRFAVTVLADDDGKPAPAMLRITSKMTDKTHRPSNAIDFAPQFDSCGHASGQRRANLPGRLGGEWWCVPGPFDMALPPGDYEIGIRRGAEHVPMFDTVSVYADQRTAKTYRPERWVDLRHLGWYSGDDHVHGRILSDLDAENLMAWLQAEDIHLANVVKMGDVFRTWFEQRGWGPAHRVIEDDRVLSPGQECPRTHEELGHTLSMNTTTMVRDTGKYFLYDWIADTVHAQGGLWGYAHVNAPDVFHVHRDMSINIPKGKCDFVELLQFSRMDTTVYYEFLNCGFKVTASAGSDVPWGGSVGEVRVYACVGTQPFTADAWFEAVRRGRTFVTNGPMIELSVDGALPGDEIVVERKRKLRVRARAWGHPERSRPAVLEIVQHGEVIRRGEPAGAGANEIALEFEIDAGQGSWLAARVRADNDTHAHTTPVYVVRKGLRFWKFDQTEELIAKRLASLDEVRQMCRDAKAQLERGELEADQTRRELALQADALLERVDAAADIYQQLQEAAEHERDIRQSMN